MHYLPKYSNTNTFGKYLNTFTNTFEIYLNTFMNTFEKYSNTLMNTIYLIPPKKKQALFSLFYLRFSGLYLSNRKV